jgi:hypothetical protein
MDDDFMSMTAAAPDMKLNADAAVAELTEEIYEHHHSLFAGKR